MISSKLLKHKKNNAIAYHSTTVRQIVAFLLPSGKPADHPAIRLCSKQDTSKIIYDWALMKLLIACSVFLFVKKFFKVKKTKE